MSDSSLCQWLRRFQGTPNFKENIASNLVGLLGVQSKKVTQWNNYSTRELECYLIDNVFVIVKWWSADDQRGNAKMKAWRKENMNNSHTHTHTHFTNTDLMLWLHTPSLSFVLYQTWERLMWSEERRCKPISIIFNILHVVHIFPITFFSIFCMFVFYSKYT